MLTSCRSNQFQRYNFLFNIITPRFTDLSIIYKCFSEVYFQKLSMKRINESQPANEPQIYKMKYEPLDFSHELPDRLSILQAVSSSELVVQTNISFGIQLLINNYVFNGVLACCENQSCLNDSTKYQYCKNLSHTFCDCDTEESLTKICSHGHQCNKCSSQLCPDFISSISFITPSTYRMHCYFCKRVQCKDLCGDCKYTQCIACLACKRLICSKNNIYKLKEYCVSNHTISEKIIVCSLCRQSIQQLHILSSEIRNNGYMSVLNTECFKIIKQFWIGIYIDCPQCLKFEMCAFYEQLWDQSEKTHMIYLKCMECEYKSKIQN